jgi:hypothetical protein
MGRRKSPHNFYFQIFENNCVQTGDFFVDCLHHIMNTTSASQKTTAKEVKIGELVRFVDRENSPVWVRGAYCRELKRYSFHHYNDVNKERFVSAKMACFIGFTF